MRTIGQVMLERREAMGLTLSQLSGLAGGSPSPSFLSRVELDQSEPGAAVAIRLADALRLPADLVLNGFGLATESQRMAALDSLGDLTTDAPQAVRVPILDPANINMPTTRLPARTVYMAKPEVSFQITLQGQEVVASREREPRDAQAVVAVVSGRPVLGTYRKAGRRRQWLDTEGGEIADFDILGVVTRRTVDLG